MKLKKLISSLLALTIFLSTYSSIIQVKAIDFEGNEDKYMNLCSSSNISRSNKSTCDQFNKYLKQKNKVMTAGKRADFRICSKQTRDKMLPSETSSLSCRHDLQGTTAR